MKNESIARKEEKLKERKSELKKEKPIYRNEAGNKTDAWDIFKDGEGYKFGNGMRINTYHVNLETIASEGLKTIKMFLETIYELSQYSKDEELARIARVGSTLANDLQHQIRAFDDFTSKNCGEIFVDRILSGEIGGFDDTIIAARFYESE